MCLTKIQTHRNFKLLPVIYFKKYVHCDMQFLVEINSSLLCFLCGFGIAVPVFRH